jgi:hypothetical protein
MTQPPPPQPPPKPATSATADWEHLRQSARAAEEHACLTAAAAHADRAWILLHDSTLGPAATPIPPRGKPWQRLAVAFYDVLRTSGAYAHLANHRPWACAAAQPVLSAWLASTDPTVDGGVTVAQRLGVGDGFSDINTDTQLAYLSTLVEAAQDAAVFGVPAHRVSLAATTDALTRIVVDPPHGPALATAPLPLLDLLPANESGVDGATAALRRVADAVTDLFRQQAHTVWTSPPPNPHAQRAFPELHLEAAPSVGSPTTGNGNGPAQSGRPR